MDATTNHRRPGPRATLRGAGLVVLVLATALAGGCAVYPRIPFEPHVSPALGEMHDGYAAIRMLLATDRNVTHSDRPGEIFGNDRSDELKYGWCEVSIPEGHCRGRLEQPGLFESPQPNRHVLLLNVEAPQGRDRVFTELKQRVAQSPRKEVLVFVPGFAVSFEQAAQRTAQLAHDLRFEGVPIVYSWPTRGWVMSYLVDTINAEWSAYYMVDFLDRLVRESDAEHIHIIAHSMGTRVLTKAIKDYSAQRGFRAQSSAAASSTEPADPAPPFDQIVLAAADMDARTFERDYAPHLAAAAQRVTVYVSGADWALGGAQRLHLYTRLGQGPLTDLDLNLLVRRIDVIDATAVDRGLLGHDYYGDSPRVLEDLMWLLQGQSPTDRARALRREFYYRFTD